MSKFVTAVLKTLNKDEKTVQKEKVEQFVQDAKIEAEIQLAQYQTGDLQKAKLQLTRDQNNLVKAQKSFEESRFRMDINFEAYLAVREKAREEVHEAEQQISKTENEISKLEVTIQELESIIADFS